MPQNSKCYIFDVFYYLLFGYLIYEVVVSYYAFSHCDYPLNVWLLVTFGFYIAKRLVIFLLKSIEDAHIFRIIIGFYLVILYPGFTYWTIHGTIWIVSDSQNADCQSHIDVFWLLYMMLSVNYILILAVFVYAIYEIIHYYRLLRIRRRIEDILNNIDVLLQANALQNAYDNNPHRIDMGLTESEKALLKPTSLEMNPGTEEECSICIDKLHENENIIVLPGCKHIFHSICVLAWLERKPFCPNCKGNIRTQIVEQMKQENN